MGRKNPKSNEAEEFGTAAEELQEFTVETGDARLPEESGSEPDALKPLEAPVVLRYDGEIPEANFPVWTPGGIVYVHAEAGKNTEPLDAVVAGLLVKSGKGFRVTSADAAPVEDR
jgi:hypothetical protein